MRIKSLTLLYATLLVCFQTHVNAVDWYAYATDISTLNLVPVNLETATADMAIPTGTRTVEVAITPDGTTACITNQGPSNDGSIGIVDLATRSIVDIPISMVPFSIAITPNGAKAYVTAYDTFTNTSYLIEIDIASRAISGSVPTQVGSQAYGIAITPDGSTAYLPQVNRLIGVNLNNLLAPFIDIPLPSGSVVGIAITPNGQTAYITDPNNSSVYQVDLVAQTLTTTISIPGGSWPRNIAISPNSQWVFLANENATFTTSIRLADNQVGTVETGSQQQGVAFAPNSQTVYLSNLYAQRLVAIDIATLGISFIATPGNFPSYLTITPDQAPLASFTVTPSQAGASTFFTSTSTTPTGTIINYQWDFGDGTIENTAFPVTSHLYTAGGNYPVTLTVTNSAGTSIAQVFTGRTVSNNGGSSAQNTQVVTISPAAIVVPIIDEILPNTGPVQGGNEVVLNGGGFTGVTGIFFGDVPATNFTFVSDAVIVVRVPPNITGAANVTVVTSLGTSIASAQSTYFYQGANLTVLPPINARGYQRENRFASQTVIVNVIEWQAPLSGPTPNFYYVYRGNKLIATVFSGQNLIAMDANRRDDRAYSYTIISALASGETSSPVSLTIAPN